MIIISHNKEFCGAVAEEKWIMQGGRLRQEGESKGTGDDAKEKGLQVEKEVSAAHKSRIQLLQLQFFQQVRDEQFWLLSIEEQFYIVPP